MNGLQSIWSWVYDAFGGNERLIITVGTTAVTNVTFWGINMFLLCADLTGRPRWMLRYKVQPDKQPSFADVMKATRTAIFNNVILSLLMFYFVLSDVMHNAGCSVTVDTVPTWRRIILDIAIFALAQEFVFYYLHRLFHHPLLYKRFHKKHHEWTAPIGIVAVYASPVEHLVVNGNTIMLAPIMMGSHILTIWIWVVLAVYTTVFHHSGYHLPFLPSPEFHDYHHLKFNWNFGTFGFLDRFHGTDSMYKNTIQSKRHRTLYGLTPMAESMPDKQKTLSAS